MSVPMGHRKIYVHYEATATATTWTKRLKLTDAMRSVGDVADAFAAAYAKKFAPHTLDVSTMAMALETNGAAATRTPVARDKQLHALLQLEDPAATGCSFDVILTPAKPIRDTKAASTATATPAAAKPVTASTSSAAATSTPARAKKHSRGCANAHNSPAPEIAPELKEVLELARTQMQQRRYRAARDLYQSLVLPLDPTNAEALFALGEIFRANAQYAQAVTHGFRKCWRAHEQARERQAAKLAFASGLEMADCFLHQRKLQQAVAIIDELQVFLRRQSKCCGFFQDSKEKEQMEAQMDCLKAQALYEMDTPEDQETAIALLMHLLPELQDPRVNLDALLLYARIAYDRGKKGEALSMVLRVLVGRSNDKAVRQQLVRFVRGKKGMERLKSAIPATSASSAAAYAFIAAILKDHGALEACLVCFQQALVANPSNASYALNYAHALEVSHRYDAAYACLQSFYAANKTLSVGGIVSCAQVLAALDQDGWTPQSKAKDGKATAWRVEWVAGEHGYAKVYGNGALVGKQVNVTASRRTTLAEDELDLLACFFTLVKILFLNGRLEALPRLISLLEPVRAGRELHRTAIRNEQAYYSCIAQLMSIQNGLEMDGTVYALPSSQTTQGAQEPQQPVMETQKPVVYVCGDSHTLATAWRVVPIRGQETLLVPALVTGLKHWHLRSESTFYPKINFWNVLETIPRGSRVVFLFGEIDCREGIIMAVEKCKYETIEEGMAHTLGIFMDVLSTIIEKYQFEVFIHPVVPVLNETRHLVIQYNRMFKKQVDKSKLCTWLDFFDKLIVDSPEKLRPDLALDGTHLHPKYLTLLGRAMADSAISAPRHTLGKVRDCANTDVSRRLACCARNWWSAKGYAGIDTAQAVTKRRRNETMAKGNAKRRAGKGKGKGAAKTDKSVAKDVFSDDDNDEKEERMNKQMDIDGVYEYEQPERFDNDSEIEEDEAFNSEDEEAYGMFFNKAKGSKKAAAFDDDDDDDAAAAEDDEDEDAPEEGADLLSDMLGTAPAKALSTVKGDDNDEGLSSDEEEDDDDATKEQKQQNLLALVDQLVPERKKKKQQEIKEDAPTSAFGRSFSGANDGELTLGSLLGAAVDDDDSNELNLSKVKKQVSTLEADSTGPLQAALAPIHEERAARKIAYEEKNKDVDVFQTVVKRNRQKETMDFRELIPKMENLTAASLSTKFEAETSLEKDVAALLKASDLSDRNIAQQEEAELAQKKVSAQEVMARQKELARMRALMFYEEQKAKRVKKIKSKLYHKIRNNQNKKEAEKAHKQLRELDPEMAHKLDEEMAEKRAEERLTLKHMNTSKWVKHQLKRGIHADNDTRSAIAEQLRRGDELRRKMNTAGSDDDMDDDGDDSDVDENVDAVTRLQRKLEKQADALVMEIDEDEAQAGKVKGLQGMKFMQRAMQKQREKARTEAEKLLREIRGDDGLLSDDDYKSSDDESTKQKKGDKKKNKKADAKNKVVVTTADKEAVAKALPKGALQTGAVSMDKGMSARSATAVAVDLGNGKAGTVQVDATKGSAKTIELGRKEKEAAAATKTQDGAVEDSEDVGAGAEENPWLSTEATKTKKRRNKSKDAKKNGEVDVGNAIDALAKSITKSENKKNKKQKSTEEQTNDAQDAAATTNGNNTAKNGKKRKLDQTKAADGPKKQKASSTEAATSKLSQEELVRRAFAFADEDEDEIAREKELIAEQDTDAKKGMEIARLMGMTGWGTWAGTGVQKSFRQQQREEQAKKLAEDTKQKVLAGRKDAKMQRVLINEKKDKKAAKFTVAESDIPYPFTSREEYEMAMRNPLGSDWNTPSATNALNAPKLIKRAGQMIDPLKLNKEEKKQAKKDLQKQRKAKF
ncbi:TPA: hypothetical protein N0F65_004118 [Lagenidium giganteum]|uniref:Uncharacterized protein n=1 Tax=Lagenidium giganteum TaxID=4803 RepID=A0AAV2Z8I1_9STRA|nr:TPA: hypothetical protein N0F65_004118 [Lagenidium giganteum]